MKDEKSKRPGTLDERQFAANGIRLSAREWFLLGLVLAGIFLLAPPLWDRWEAFEPGADYRIPHASSEDYWQYERWAGRAAAEFDILVIGDSVVWGEYVAPEGTLTHFLNEATSERRFANLGLAGMHPAPLAGLIEHYGGDIRAADVILHCNPLWMSSPRHDLRGEKEFAFNHPLLVPQFTPWIPCYRRSISERTSSVVRRNVPFFSWTRHLQIAYFDQRDIPAWTLEHPARNPLAAITMEASAPARTPRHTAVSWQARGIPRQDFDWVDPETSLQWHSFQRTVEILRRRKNRLLVVLGPFNEHLLTETGQASYHELRQVIVKWLERSEIPYVAPKPLPSELYADASHPLAEGYARLARVLLESPFLQEK